MKITNWLVIVAMLTVWTCPVAVAVDKHNPAASKVLDLERQWNDIYKRGDVVTMDALLADDYIITVEDGATFSKPGYLAHNGNSTVHVEISKMSDLNVRMHGNTAVVTGAYHEKGIDNGMPYEYHDRLTDVWINTNGKWQLIASHYSSANN